MEWVVYLFDPSGAGIIETDGMIIVRPKIIREVGKFSLTKPRILQPGLLLVTQGALDKLGDSDVLKTFESHLSGDCWFTAGDEIKEYREALDDGGGVYNIDRRRDIMCITYPTDSTTLILRDEY